MLLLGGGITGSPVENGIVELGLEVGSGLTGVTPKAPYGEEVGSPVVGAVGIGL
jgi:hypothetical protein